MSLTPSLMFPEPLKPEPTTLFGCNRNREMSPQIRVIEIKTNCYRSIEAKIAPSSGKRIEEISTKHTAEKIKTTAMAKWLKGYITIEALNII